MKGVCNTSSLSGVQFVLTAPILLLVWPPVCKKNICKPPRGGSA